MGRNWEKSLLLNGRKTKEIKGNGKKIIINPKEELVAKKGKGSCGVNSMIFRGGGGYRPMSFGGKNMKRRREKRGKCKRKRKKEERKIKIWERKGEKGK
jgi:hypothetical protein